MAEKRESNKLHDDAFRIREAINKYKMNDIKHLTYEEVCTILRIYHAINQEEPIQGSIYPEGNNPKTKSIGQLKVDIDCSDALKGLKAVTREAKKATAALKELEEQQSKFKVDWYTAGGQIVIDGVNDARTIAKELQKQMENARARGVSF